MTDPSRNPWLRGRQLWLQIVVRGFWRLRGKIGIEPDLAALRNGGLLDSVLA
jgi:hypothetical protein